MVLWLGSLSQKKTPNSSALTRKNGVSCSRHLIPQYFGQDTGGEKRGVTFALGHGTSAESDRVSELISCAMEMGMPVSSPILFDEILDE